MSWPHFSDREMTCRCGCGQVKMNFDFMTRLEKLREMCGFPFIVTSGYRCKVYNMTVSTSRDGPHTTGRAIDIFIRGDKAIDLVCTAYMLGFTGFGIRQKGDKRFIHLDDLEKPEFNRPTIWSY